MIWNTLLPVCLGMTLLWGVQRVRGNAAVVDVGWTASIAFTHLSFALQGGGDPRRSLLLAGLVSLWAWRLGGHLYRTRVRGHVEEEGRYKQLREEWGKDTERNLFLFFQAQGVLAVVLVLPFLPVYRNPQAGLGGAELIGCALFLLGMAGVATADNQLAAFKRDPGNQGKVCQSGLWSWSRHPNYFFESVEWCAWAVFALGSPAGAWAWISPAMIVYFILRVTGIPPTEAQSLRSKGEAYREYQRRTSVFVPLPPRA